MSYYKHKTLRFQCTACGRCCYGNKDDYIRLTEKEAKYIRTYLHLPNKEFSSRFLSSLPDGTQGIRILANGRCSLLDETDKCSVYDARPRQCRTYPFWPELVSNKFRWKAEKQRCEGINQGEVIALEYIETQLELCKK